MRKYVTGFVVGVALGAALPAAAASLVGGSGYLLGWSVTKNGREICYMPFIWTSIKEIEC